MEELRCCYCGLPATYRAHLGQCQSNECKHWTHDLCAIAGGAMEQFRASDTLPHEDWVHAQRARSFHVRCACHRENVTGSAEPVAMDESEDRWGHPMGHSNTEGQTLMGYPAHYRQSS